MTYKRNARIISIKPAVLHGDTAGKHYNHSGTKFDLTGAVVRKKAEELMSDSEADS